MFETMSIYSLVLMLSAALLFPPAFRHLLGAPRRVLLRTSWNLWTVTLLFAALCWYLAALWAQADRPLAASLAVVISLLVLFVLAFASLPFQPRPGLRQLSLILAVLLLYAIACWAIKSLFAAVSGATFDTQALMFGYLLLCPALTAALLPRPRPIATGLFILLTALLLYAIGIWATSAFWGTIPTPPASMQPGIVIMVSLLILATLVWMGWQAHDMPMTRLAGAYLIALGRFLVGLVAAIGLAILSIVLDYARLLFTGARWIVSVLIPGVGVAVARGSVVLLQMLWRGIKSIPVLFWNITVGIGNGLVNAVIWFVSVPLLGIGRGIIAIGDGLWRGSGTVVRALFRASGWLVTFALPSLLSGLAELVWGIGRSLADIVFAIVNCLVALAGGIAGGLMGLGRVLVHVIVTTPRVLWRAGAWFVRYLIPGIGHVLLAILQVAHQGISTMGREIWHGLNALIRGFARGIRQCFAALVRMFVLAPSAIRRGLVTLCTAVVRGIVRAVTWVVRVLVPRIGRSLVTLVGAIGNSCVRLVGTVGHGLVSAARAFWNAAVWLAAIAVPHVGGANWYSLIALARRLVRAGAWVVTAALPAIGRGLIAIVRGIWNGLVALASALGRLVLGVALGSWRAGVGLITIALPAIGRGLAAVAQATWRALLAMVRGLTRALIWLVATAPALASRKMLRAVRTSGRALLWTVTVLLPGIPQALLLFVQELAEAIGHAVYNLRTGFISKILVPVFRIGRAVRDTLGVVLWTLRRVPSPVYLISTSALVVVLAAAIAWPFITNIIWSPPAPSLRIVGGSNLKSLEPILQRWGSENQVTVQVAYRGSLDIQSLLEHGNIQYDAVWQGDSLWTTTGDKSGLLKDSQSIMCSPVVLGVKKPVASRLGWVDNKPVRLREILDTAESSKLRMFMASPAKSNSGALAYLSFLNAFDYNPNRATRLLRRIERTGDSSGWLRDTCRDQYGQCDAMINYESLILEMNREMVTRGQEPMYIVYPAEGFGLADFPLSFVKTGNAAKESLFLRLQSYLRSDAVQNEIAAFGNRVGERCDRANDTIFRPEWGADLTRTTESVRHPEKSVIDPVLNEYQKTFRKPSFTVYLLDFSTSMQGSRRSYLQTAMSMVLDQKEAAEFKLQGTSDDATIVIPFAGRILTDEDIRSWTVSGSDSEELGALLKKIQNQSTADMTNIYTPVAKALYLMREEDLANYMPSIILLTDGESNRGSIAEVKQALQETGLYNVPIFGITFGDASQQQLNELAGLTGGRVFDGTKNLVEAFRQAKGQN